MIVLKTTHLRELALAHALSALACQQRDALQAKIDRMTGGLRQNRRKVAGKGEA